MHEFEKSQEHTIITGPSPLNSVYVLTMLLLMAIIPVFMAARKKLLART